MYRNVISVALALGLLAASTLSAPAQVYGTYNNSLPGGSYQQSCSNATIRGSILAASCNAPNGRQVWSQIDVSRCNGGAIANNNGYLTCQGKGYYQRPGYRNPNARNGYYRNGHGSGREHGRDKDERGDNDNDDNDNANNDQYGNNGYNNSYGLLPGSYQQSCTNERIGGTMLYASCATANGGYRNTAIDVRQCQSQGRPIENINGNLAC